ncbi:LOW QUALITY PROTEIN: dehydrogenase/reductase (SDR family) member 7Cb [Centroberyx gerrardi]
MALPLVMVLPLLVVVAAGVYYIYNEVTQFMSKSLVRNKVVVITDAVSGVGSECAHLFHKAGARLILCGTSWDKLESLFDSLTNDADPRETFAPKLVILDFSDMDSMEEVVAEVLECYGCVDVLICNSSMKLKAPVQSVSLELDRNIMDINYFGPSSLAKGVLPTMISRRSGHIVLVNSIQGRLAVPFRSSYAASKHAAQAFFDCLRAEVEEYGIVVSTISHTFIDASGPPPPPAPPAFRQPEPPKPNRLAAFIASQLTHGVRPSVLANEIMCTVNRKRKEVVLAHPIPRVALYLRALFPPVLFSVLAAGVKDSALAEQMQ